MKAQVLFFISAIFLLSCSAGKQIDLATVQNPSEVQKMILNKNFECIADYANPTTSNELNQIANSNLLGAGNSAGRISLLGNTNFLLVKGDSVNAYLPYYGTRQVTAGIGKDKNAIKFEGLAKNFKSSYDEKNERTRVTFSAENGTETFDILMLIFNNKRTDITVNSSQRNAISYDGYVGKPTEK